MTPDTPRAAARDDVRAVARGFQVASTPHAVWQLVTTLPPLIALLAAMHATLAFGVWWLLPGLALLAAGFVIRTFVLQHDCGHGSLFASRRLNDWVGRCCSLFTCTPYGFWRRQHATHHAVWNDLDGRDRGVDLYSTCATVAEYQAMGRWHRIGHRALRHPLVALFLLPPVIFLLVYRVPFDSPSSWARERRGVHLTTLALVLVYGAVALFLGLGPMLAVLLAVMVPSSIIGVWLFSVQHKFEGVHWARRDAWDPVDASIAGSSFLALPAVLRWFTAAIGFHHVHHLAPRVPNYRLAACHAAHPDFAKAQRLTFWAALRAPRLGLWDEQASRMISFAEAEAGIAAGRR